MKTLSNTPSQLDKELDLLSKNELYLKSAIIIFIAVLSICCCELFI